MSFAINVLHPVEITVDARMGGQQIINKWWYRCASTPGGGGDSGFLLANFRDLYRLNVLTLLYSDYQIVQYVCREIESATLSAGAVPNRYRNVYRVDGLDTLAGVTTTDAGQNALGVGELRLPAHEAARVFRRPTARVLRYWRGNYERFTSLTTAEKDATREIWKAATVTAWNAALAAFNVTIAANAGGTILWQPVVWSPQYFGAVLKLPGLPILNATASVDTMTLVPYVGTQVSRRYSPSGLAHGK